MQNAISISEGSGHIIAIEPVKMPSLVHTSTSLSRLSLPGNISMILSRGKFKETLLEQYNLILDFRMVLTFFDDFEDFEAYLNILQIIVSRKIIEVEYIFAND